MRSALFAEKAITYSLLPFDAMPLVRSSPKIVRPASHFRLRE